MSIKIGELSAYLDEAIPSSLSCEWDNDGVMVCVNRETTVKKILFTLDVTMDSLVFAHENGCDTVISHHPLIFRPIRSVTGDTISSGAAIYAVKNGISVLSYHTRLDALPIFGVNDTLAAILNVLDVKPFGPSGEEIGRMGNINTSMPFADFCYLVKERLNTGTLITVNAAREVHTVALIGGDGKDYLMPAIAAGADTFLTGRCGYNLDIDAAQYGINVIEAGHYNTEAPVLKSIERLISQKFAGLEYLYYNSDRTKAI